jgi:hypothetical protein
MRYVVGLGPSWFKWLYKLSVIPHLFEKGYICGMGGTPILSGRALWAHPTITIKNVTYLILIPNNYSREKPPLKFSDFSRDAT